VALVTLRLLSARVPYRRAGISFEPNGAQSFAVVLVPAETLSEDQVNALIEDPHIDVLASLGGFDQVEDAEHLSGMIDFARQLSDAGAKEDRLLRERTLAETGGPHGDELQTETAPPPADQAGAGEAAPAAAEQPSEVAAPAKPGGRRRK
jgi:hypothetical protein